MFERIISLENLFSAWNEFRLGKEGKLDVQEFGLDIEDNIFELHEALKNNTYVHSTYKSFYLHDPKLRHIFKANVRDRILHHAIVKIIGPIFDRTFIFDSYSSRKNKGTHKAITRFRCLARKLSKNNSRTIWVLKCDIKKFFDSTNHRLILNQVGRKIKDHRALKLIQSVVDSINTSTHGGIPLGNLTSQLFSNVYLDDLDQFVKRKLRVKYYLRYNDDFLILGLKKRSLEDFVKIVTVFLRVKLGLELHPLKVSIMTWHQGIDFLGYMIFPYHEILRTKTKRRLLRKISWNLQKLRSGLMNKNTFRQSLQSYLGVLSHCCGHGIKNAIDDLVNE